MNILLTGGKGMLARTLIRRWSPGNTINFPDREDMDVCSIASVSSVIAALRPHVVVHCAAHTQVDACETAVDSAFAINAIGSANVAIACHRAGVRLIAISTDYVFRGDLDRPYREWDATGPRTVYGASKLAGEEAVRAHCPEHLIARIAWLYGPGGPSFVHTMLKFGAQTGAPMKVVNDQIGNPTSTDAVADALEPLLPPGGPVGTFHSTCTGEATWFDFTREIFRLKGLTREVVPCATSEYPRPAPRPANSRLDGMARRLHGLPPVVPWQDALQRFLSEFPTG